MSAWSREVTSAYDAVWSEIDEFEQAILWDIPVVAARGDGDAWGRYFFADRHIEVYEEAFDAMPDPENRTRQLQDVIRHELHHGLGSMHAVGESQIQERLSPEGALWLSGDAMTARVGDIVIHMPEVLP